MSIAAIVSASLTSSNIRSLPVTSPSSFHLTYSLKPSSLALQLNTPKLTIGNPSSRFSVSAMSVTAQENLSQASFIDQTATGALHFVKYQGLGRQQTHQFYSKISVELGSSYRLIISMALRAFTVPLRFKNSDLFGNGSLNIPPIQSRTIVHIKPWVIEARARTRVESPKVRNRRLQKKYNGTQKKPRLSVFCSGKQLYAMLVDDQNKKCLFYGSTLQQSVRSTPDCTTIEAAQRVGEEVIKACGDLGIDEISSYDRNGFSRGAKMEAFEIALSDHGFLFC